ncbi:MAG: PEP-CTERM sorting domain-containing protein [Verrucomicrobiota bacterium JB023]|nr:PEP-CTERM sorting domain-containing protein [Verrucomicrobiota bacterium JB023]
MNRSLPFYILPLLTSVAYGQQLQIDWGTSAVNQKIITSDGFGISLNEFSIELGGFADGFIPTESNVDDWVANWQVFDAVTSGDSDSSDNFASLGIGSTQARFVGSDLLESGQTSASADSNGTDTFGPAQQAYVFIRNVDTPGPDAEWSLYTRTSDDAWVYPTVTGGQPATPLSWYLSQADTAVWGSVNGTIDGGGLHSDSSVDFVIRTHTFVPEPGSALLVLLASGCLAMRRRRI